MTPTFTPDAKRILANPEYAAWQPQSNDIHVDVIKFNIPEFLAGAFEDQYGLVFVEHVQDAQQLQEQLAQVKSDLENSCSILYMPAAAMIRFATANPERINGYKDPVTQQGYSEMDKPYLAEDIQARLVPWDGPHAVTAVTKKGKAALLKNLKAADKSHYEALRFPHKQQPSSTSPRIRTGARAIKTAPFVSKPSSSLKPISWPVRLMANTAWCTSSTSPTPVRCRSSRTA